MRERTKLVIILAAGSLADVPDEMSVPEELARRADRLRRLAEASAKIEAREEKAKRTGRKPGGRAPQPPTAGPGAKDQINLTDEDSRIMPAAGGGFEQAYNAQVAVATDVVQAANDKQQIEPVLEELERLPEGSCHTNRVTCCCWRSTVAGCRKFPMPDTDFRL